MKFLRRIAGIFGLLKDESHEQAEENDEDNVNHNQHQNSNPRNNHPRPPTTGFSVQVPVTVDRAHLPPLLTPSYLLDGGVQGLRWYARRLRIDEDGDVADEFLEEVLPEVVEMPCNTEDVRPITKFEVNYSARPAKVRTQVISSTGKVEHSVEHQGKLLLV